jgi:hypothetical protein
MAGPPLPNFLILGAQKCGTTTLATALRDHPGIFIPVAKEAHYFDRSEAPVEAYRAFFSDWSGERRIGEATPEYVYWPHAAERIKGALPDARFVVLVRNPIDRAYSAFWHGVRIGIIRTDFAQALADEPRYLARGKWGFRSLVDRGKYLRQLQRYERFAGRERLHVELSEDLYADPFATLDRVGSFLGVEPFGWRPLRRLNENRQPPRSTPRVARRLLHRAGTKSPSVRSQVHGKLHEQFTAPPMNPILRAGLVETFRPWNAALGEWLGRDLSHWNC